MRSISLLALSLLMFSSAHAQETQTAGSIEFMLGFASDFSLDPDNVSPERPHIKADTGAAFGIIPAIDFPIGSSVVSLGAEWMLVWFPRDHGDRRLVMSPNVRLRMDFPIIPKVSVGALFAIGPSWWTKVSDPSDDRHVGYGVRFAFGGSYDINPSVQAFAQLGYYYSDTFDHNATYEFDTVPLGVGLRGLF